MKWKSISAVAACTLAASCISVPAALATGNNDHYDRSKPCQNPNPPTPPEQPPTPPSVPPEQPPTPPTPPEQPPTPPSVPPVTPVTPPCAVCQSKRTFTIRASASAGTLRSAEVHFAGKRVRMHKRADGRFVAVITFYGRKYFPGQRTEVIGVSGITTDGRHVGAVRDYRPCTKKLGFLNKPWIL